MSDSPQRDDEREPLDRVKPPREWRSRPRPSVGRPGTGRRAPARSTRRPTAPPDATAPPVASAPPVAPVQPARDRPALSPGVHTIPSEPPSQPHARVPHAVTDRSDELAPLPDRYNEDHLTLLVRDPYWCFASWELTSLSRARLAVPPDRAPVLRFYDVTELVWDGCNHREARDVVVHADVGSWYVELGRPGASFIAELGFYDDDGGFVALALSNRVDMPRAGPSPDVDPAWLPLTESPRLYLSEEALATLDSSAGLSSPGGSGTAHPRSERDESK